MISRSSVVKSPTSVGVVPTLELAPLMLIRTCSRSGNAGVLTVRVQKVAVLPFSKVIGGVSNQLLIVLVPVVFSKLAPI